MSIQSSPWIKRKPNEMHHEIYKIGEPWQNDLLCLEEDDADIHNKPRTRGDQFLRMSGEMREHSVLYKRDFRGNFCL